MWLIVRQNSFILSWWKSIRSYYNQEKSDLAFSAWLFYIILMQLCKVNLLNFTEKITNSIFWYCHLSASSLTCVISGVHSMRDNLLLFLKGFFIPYERSTPLWSDWKQNLCMALEVWFWYFSAWESAVLLIVMGENVCLCWPVWIITPLIPHASNMDTSKANKKPLYFTYASA